MNCSVNFTWMKGKGSQGDVWLRLELTLYLRAGKRTDCSCGRKVLSCLGGLLRAGQRTDCSGQALEAAGFELLRGAPFLSVARSSCWTQKGTPYGVHDAIC